MGLAQLTERVLDFFGFGFVAAHRREMRRAVDERREGIGVLGQDLLKIKHIVENVAHLVIREQRGIVLFGEKLHTSKKSPRTLARSFSSHGISCVARAIGEFIAMSPLHSRRARTPAAAARAGWFRFDSRVQARQCNSNYGPHTSPYESPRASVCSRVSPGSHNREDHHYPCRVSPRTLFSTCARHSWLERADSGVFQCHTVLATSSSGMSSL